MGIGDKCAIRNASATVIMCKSRIPASSNPIRHSGIQVDFAVSTVALSRCLYQAHHAITKVTANTRRVIASVERFVDMLRESQREFSDFSPRVGICWLR